MEARRGVSADKEEKPVFLGGNIKGCFRGRLKGRVYEKVLNRWGGSTFQITERGT